MSWLQLLPQWLDSNFSAAAKMCTQCSVLVPCRDVLLHNHNRPMFGVIDQSNPKSAEFEKASILSAR